MATIRSRLHRAIVAACKVVDRRATVFTTVANAAIERVTKYRERMYLNMDLAAAISDRDVLRARVEELEEQLDAARDEALSRKLAIARISKELADRYNEDTIPHIREILVELGEEIGCRSTKTL